MAKALVSVANGYLVSVSNGYQMKEVDNGYPLSTCTLYFKIDCEVPGKITIRFLRTGRFLSVSIRVSRFLLGFNLQNPCGFS